MTIWVDACLHYPGIDDCGCLTHHHSNKPFHNQLLIKTLTHQAENSGPERVYGEERTAVITKYMGRKDISTSISGWLPSFRVSYSVDHRIKWLPVIAQNPPSSDSFTHLKQQTCPVLIHFVRHSKVIS
jgi:hypothetical protein